MKKIIYLFCLICTITLAKGQYYRPDRGFLLGINAGYFYPTGDMGKILKNGIGGNVSAKYLINKMIGIGFEAGYYGFKTKVNLNKDDVSQKYKYHLIPVPVSYTHLDVYKRQAFILRIERLVREIKHLSNQRLGITLSLGEQTEDTYRRWFDAGAHRYLLRIETSNESLYRKIHPAGQLHDFHTRLECIRSLQRCGYQTGRCV